jgi:hypothetical protein
MRSPRLPLVVAAAGVASGWCAARYAAFSPLFWLVILVAVLAIPPRERRLVDPGFFLAGLALVTLSWVVAADHEGALRLSLLLLSAVLLFSLSRLAVPDDRLLGLVALGLALTAVVGFDQALGGLERVRGFVDTLPAQWREAAMIRLGRGRVFGTSTLPGHYAALLLLAAPLLAERACRTSGWPRAGYGAALAAIAAAVALTRSVAAVIVAGVLLLILLLGKLRGPWAAVAMVALVAVAGFMAATRVDLLSLEPIRLRWVNWRTTAWVLAHHPWLGVGLGGVGQAGLLAPTAAGNITPFAHNTVLQLLAEFGLAGAGVLAGGVWALVRLLRAGWGAYPGLALSVAVLPLHNLLDFSAYAPEVLLPWVVLAGALAGRVCAGPRRRLPGWLLVTVLAGATLLAALAWRGEVELAPTFSSPPGQAVESALAAARWMPWTVTPLELAAGVALQGGSSPEVLSGVDVELASRAWVRPFSASWAEARGRLLLMQGRPGEALVWAREARRRAPWRQGLAELEAACSLAR